MVHATTDKYLTLLDHLEQGYCIIEALLDASGNAIDGRTMEANPAFEEQTGLRSAVGKTLGELSGAHTTIWVEIINEVIRTGDTIHLEKETCRPGGRAWYDIVAFPSGEQGENKVAVLVKDITQQMDTGTLAQRKQLEQALRESESWLNGQKEAFRAAMEGQPLARSLEALIRTAIAQTDGEARAAFYAVPSGSKGLHLIAGMSDDYARDIDGFAVGPESLACGLAMHTGEPVITPDIETDPLWEKWRPIARKFDYRGCWSFPVRTEGGPILGTFAMYFRQPRSPSPKELELTRVVAHAAAVIISRHAELVEGYHVEEALRESERQLKTLVRLRDEFIGNASHELKTPLTSIMVYVDILDEHLNKITGEPYTGMIRKLSAQVGRLNALVNDMLDATRAAEGRLVLMVSRVDLNELIRERSEELRRITSNHKIELQLAPLPEVEADRERIGRVITNLISNAIKYSPRGGDILLATELESPITSRPVRVRVSVTDHGMGIPQAALEKVFERFYRIDSAEIRTFPGMGIGLTICKAIVELHKGCISVISQEGSGTTVTFTIPIRAVEHH